MEAHDTYMRHWLVKKKNFDRIQVQQLSGQSVIRAKFQGGLLEMLWVLEKPVEKKKRKGAAG